MFLVLYQTNKFWGWLLSIFDGCLKHSYKVFPISLIHQSTLMLGDLNTLKVTRRANLALVLRVDLNPPILKICASCMSVWNISANYVLVPVKLNWTEIFETILEVFTSWFQRAKAWEHEFGHVPSISFIFTGSKMARISMIYYTDVWQAECIYSSRDRCWLFSRKVVGSNPGRYHGHICFLIT